jgi:hypothetical protein
LIPPRKGGIKRASGGGRVEHHCEGEEVKSDLLSRESKQRVTWNFSPFVFSIPKETGGNLTCGPPIEINKLFIAVVPLQILLRLLRLFILKTELKANGYQLFDLFLRKVRFINMDICLDICLEISTLLGTPHSQRGAVMRATMSFLFVQSKKLVVAVIP